MSSEFQRRIERQVDRAFSWGCERGLTIRPNDARLLALRDRHAGESCVVIGMGPSLQPEDLDRFSRMKSFACNKIFLGFTEAGWRPDYYFVMDEVVAANNAEAIRNADLGKAQALYPRPLRKLLGNPPGSIAYRYRGKYPDVADAHIKTDLVRGIYAYGYTVIADMIQFAYLMGFTTVYLVGLDFSFSYDPSAKTGEALDGGEMEVLVSSGEQNHFHKDYRNPGETWTVPRLDDQKAAFAFYDAAFRRSGRKIFNASRVSKLDVFERIPFDEVFPESD